MWKFTAKYENFNGEQKEKVLRFNLTPSEIRKLQFSRKGGIDKYYQEMVESIDYAAIYNAFEELIKASYGIISEDGDQFIKSEEQCASLIGHVGVNPQTVIGKREHERADCRNDIYRLTG